MNYWQPISLAVEYVEHDIEPWYRNYCIGHPKQVKEHVERDAAEITRVLLCDYTMAETNELLQYPSTTQAYYIQNKMNKNPFTSTQN